LSEGKYWKRKLNTVTAEYKKWRIFYKHQHTGAQADSFFKTTFLQNCFKAVPVLAVLWILIRTVIRIRKDPKLFAGSESRSVT
jgi:hypothetical protein